jgi:pilus assembly protein Flp/PilA
MLEHLKRLLTGEEGQGMAEYGLILALVAVVVIGALTALGGSIKDKFNEVVKTGLGGTPAE